MNKQPQSVADASTPHTFTYFYQPEDHNRGLSATQHKLLLR